MPRAIALRADFDAPILRRLARRSKQAAQARRLLALAAIYDGGRRSEAARLGNVTLQIVRDWVLRFNAEGPDGLPQALGPAEASRPGGWRHRGVQKNVPATLAGIACEQGLGLDAIEIWFADEARVGQKNAITRRGARRGTWPSAPQDQRDASIYIFGAVCPQDGKGAALALPFCNTAAMNLHLAEISEMVSPARHAVLLLDQAGWHLCGDVTVPDNIPLLPLPPKCPEVNVMENVRQFMRDNWLSNRVFRDHDDIVAHCCHAWNRLVDQPWRIMSIGLRDWAHGF